jgi:hypothetical protein
LVETEHALEAPLHISLCSSTSYDSNPPSSGHHYPTWAAFGEYDFALPRGFWVHNLEHGAIVVSHRCDEDCGGELEAAKLWFAGLAVDDFCAAGGAGPRALMVHDPRLDTEWAASAWGYTLTGSCFEPERFTQFYLDHVGNGPENVCSSGTIVTGLDQLPEGCGQ